ncbi:NAD(P)-dependent oxidoreductase [Franzmannia qiaohouensis]|uniref:NAD(P)-dependent oxidoreductase n=1 Tax=Franzmannia qiaohouensis TaxID=1329370 RepID=A0ABU1HL43_9GAMM|nr:NAD(P)-dependent oxidoreductase [Halomonas qiaohouensis]MDR5907748.1 NAD(P)-dependent oxidoreductase [Halomonas qiaohouensis]
MKTVIFAGLGSMGWPMASNLHDAGIKVVPYDVDAEKVQEFQRRTGTGGEVNPSLPTVDGLLIMVVNAQQVRSLLFEQGMIEKLKPGACIVQMSTISPADSAKISHEIRDVRVDLHFVDAPVSGGVVGAQQGSLTIMAAGIPAALTACRDVFEVLGGAIFPAGDQPGQGSAFKSVNQLLCGVHIAAAAEALSLAEKNGLDLETMVEMLGASAASSWMLKDRGPRMILPPDEITSVVDIFCKDLGIVCESAKQSRAYTPLANASYQLFVASSERGEGKLDDSQLIRTYRLLNGM